MTQNMRQPFGPEYGFALYVHWPYCAKICPYCDFNVYAAKGRDASVLADALVADLLAHKTGLDEHPPLDSISFGGGTPSLMPPGQMHRVIEAARELFGLKTDVEISLEANPNDVTAQSAAAWRDIGINRLSVGVQSLRDDALQFLGRDHDAAGAMRAIKTAMSYFPSVSIDMIYARPGQSGVMWEEELAEAFALNVHHLSLYELTIGPDTAFGKAAQRGHLIPMGDEGQALLYELTEDLTREAGYEAYEVSNHARNPFHRSRHNSIYWASGDWIGIGPGAHGRLSLEGGRIATEAEKRPSAYIERVESGATGWPVRDALSAQDVARELVSMGLRDLQGVERARIEALKGEQVSPDKLDAFMQEGWIACENGRIALTPPGRLLADALAAELAP